MEGRQTRPGPSAPVARRMTATGLGSSRLVRKAGRNADAATRTPKNSPLRPLAEASRNIAPSVPVASCGAGWSPGRELVGEVGHEGGGGRVVEHQRGRQPQPGGRAQPVAQLHRGERVEAQLRNGRCGLDGSGRRVAEDRRGVRPDQVEQAVPRSSAGSRASGAGRRAPRPARRRRPARPGRSPRSSGGSDRRRGGRSAARSRPRGTTSGRSARQRGVEQRRGPARRLSAPMPPRAMRARVGVGERAGHAARPTGPRRARSPGRPCARAVVRRARRGRRWRRRSWPGRRCRTVPAPRRTARTRSSGRSAVSSCRLPGGVDLGRAGRASQPLGREVGEQSRRRARRRRG